MVALDTTVFILQLIAIPTLLILPAQKSEIQALIASGAKSDLAAKLVVGGMVFCFCWSLMGNLLLIFPSTACLKLVGGKGC